MPRSFYVSWIRLSNIFVGLSNYMCCILTLIVLVTTIYAQLQVNYSTVRGDGGCRAGEV